MDSKFSYGVEIMLMKEKKSIIGPVISVFIMVLIISILAGLTFLFVAQLKNNVLDTTATQAAGVTNESTFLNGTGDPLAGSTALGARSFANFIVINGSSGVVIPSANYTVTSAGVIFNSSTNPINYANANISYTYVFASQATAYNAVNGTEAAGAGLVSYLSLIFLAIIFGAILTLVLRIILPYINLGNSMGGF